MTPRHRTHPSRGEFIAWITLQAAAVTLIVAAGIVGVLALAALLS